MRISFNQLFAPLQDGAFSPRKRARIRGVDLKPGLWIGEGVGIPGLDLLALQGRDLEIEVEQGTPIIRGAY